MTAILIVEHYFVCFSLNKHFMNTLHYFYSSLLASHLYYYYTSLRFALHFTQRRFALTTLESTLTLHNMKQPLIIVGWVGGFFRVEGVDAQLLRELARQRGQATTRARNPAAGNVRPFDRGFSWAW